MPVETGPSHLSHVISQEISLILDKTMSVPGIVQPQGSKSDVNSADVSRIPGAKQPEKYARYLQAIGTWYLDDLLDLGTEMYPLVISDNYGK